jgi:hypothetical protein
LSWLDFGMPAGYAWTEMVDRPINVEERIDRVVGRRRRGPDALSSASSRKADAVAWQQALGGTGVPRGVHRFRTHEEADDWLWRMIARPKRRS